MTEKFTLKHVPENVKDILTMKIFDNSLLVWAFAIGGIALAYMGLRILQVFAIRHFRKLAQKPHLKWTMLVVEALEDTKPFLLLLIAVWAATQELHLTKHAANTLHMAGVITLLLQCGLWAMVFLNSWMKHTREKQLISNPGAVTTLGAISLVMKLGVWVSVGLLTMNTMGINISTLVAGLGIGGVAVALAVQHILGDLFASLTIAIDKPFVVGDFIILGEHMGTVEHIGLKSTRIRSLSGEQIILSNSDLLNSRIRNYGRMYERRVLVTVGVTYQTPRDKLILIPKIIKEAIESQEKTRFDRAHFKSYGASSIDFEYVFYVLVSDYNTYMDINQAVNLHLHERFEQEGIEFAYPTQTLFLQRA